MSQQHKPQASAYKKFAIDMKQDQRVMDLDGNKMVSPLGSKTLYPECGVCYEAIMQPGHAGRHPNRKCLCVHN